MKGILELPARWQSKVEAYLKRPGAKYKELSIADFVNHLSIAFEDGSTAYFRYSFYLIDESEGEIAVFTEHCGYHVFPSCVSKIETIDMNGLVVYAESFLSD